MESGSCGGSESERPESGRETAKGGGKQLEGIDLGDARDIMQIALLSEGEEASRGDLDEIKISSVSFDLTN